MCSSPVRHSPPVRASSYCAAVRLACVRPAASVHSEPGSNSSLKITCPKANYFSCRSSTTGNLSLAKQLICCLIKRLQDGQSSFLQASAQITCAHCQRTSGVASAPFPSTSTFPSKLAAHCSGLFLAVNTFMQMWLTPLRLPPKGFRRTQPDILARFASLSTPREENVDAAAL